MLRFRILLTEVSNEPDAPKELPQPYIGPVAAYSWVME